MTELATPKHIADRSGSAIISLGEGIDLELTKGGELQITQWDRFQLKAFIPLGKAATKRFIDLQNHLARLIIHAVDA